MKAHFTTWIILCVVLGVAVGWFLQGVWHGTATWDLTADNFLRGRSAADKIPYIKRLLGNPVGGGAMGLLVGLLAAYVTHKSKKPLGAQGKHDDLQESGKTVTASSSPITAGSAANAATAKRPPVGSTSAVSNRPIVTAPAVEARPLPKRAPPPPPPPPKRSV